MMLRGRHIYTFSLWKRFGALCLALLLLYNMAGPAILLSALRAAVRKEVKEMLKSDIPDEKLHTITVSSAEQQSTDFQWIHKREFRYKGNMYDIVRTEQRGDVTVYRCIHDIEEEQLIESQKELVQETLNNKRSSSRLPLHSAIRHLITHALIWCAPELSQYPSPVVFITSPCSPLQIIPTDIPTPPPETTL